MKSNKKIIGLSGVARSGKDTFAAILLNKLSAAGHTAKRIALADPLKDDCDAFCEKHFGISAFTQVPEEKILLRPFFVWYGDVQRKRTNGRYWIEKAQNTIKESSAEYYIITDVRYSAYEKDELYWLQTHCNGIVCHISKWKAERNFRSDYREYVLPANEHEAENDPKIKKLANHCVEWEHVSGLSADELQHAPSLVAHVDSFIYNFFDL